MPASEALLARVRAYIAQDIDPDDRAELQALVDGSDERELRERFSGPLRFGTAGIRGLLGAGESRMNRSVVVRTSFGVVSHLLAKVEGAAERGVVVARDARLRSDVFQRDTAGVAAALGARVHWLEGPTPTPLLAFAVKHLGAAGGVMITASHNPPRDNGYKVYWENGAQIVPPVDVEIAARIDAAPGARDVPRDPEASRIERVTVEDAYRDAVLGLLGDASEPPTPMPIAYTALHGVGETVLRRLFEARGHRELFSVASQAEPDGRFPTVAFPNPEEPGALDAALALAEQQECGLVLANDPDADRLGAAVRRPDGGYRVLNGNEIGVLMGSFVLSRPRTKTPLVLSTVVSSRMLARVAAANGARYEDTLTGFKWIANEALRLEREEDVEFVFGYEEALGYTVGRAVRDKDGLSAALVLAEQASVLAKRGETLLDELGRLQKRFGPFTSRQKSVVLTGADGAAAIASAMERLRNAGLERIGDERVHRFQDLAHSSEPRMRANVLLYDLADGGRVAVRPSGTEPKIKFYLEVTGGDPETRLDAMERDLLDLALQ